jgi:hypothetical protein
LQPFHAGDCDRLTQARLQQRQIALNDLILQRLGAGRDHHLLAAQQRRHEIAKRLARTGARLYQQRRIRMQRSEHRLRHRHLRRPRLVRERRAREQAARPEPGLDVHAGFHEVAIDQIRK